MDVGDTVKILTSFHSAIITGEIGIVACRKNRGFGVTFDKVFPTVLSNIKPVKEKRTIYFEAEQLELLGKVD